MKKKKESCKYCGEKLDAKTTRAEFCSPKCKVYWHRENPKVVLKNFNKQSTGTTKNYTEKQPETNYSINTMPKKEDFEDVTEFWAARTEWKKKHNL